MLDKYSIRDPDLLPTKSLHVFAMILIQEEEYDHTQDRGGGLMGWDGEYKDFELKNIEVTDA